jgi:hypothetical protein
MKQQRDQVWLAGLIGIIGGGLWVVLILADVFLREGLADGDARFRTWEAGYVAVQLLILVGLLGLAGSHAVGSTRIGRMGIGLAIGARVLFVVGELHCLVWVIEDSPFLPLAAVLTGVGMTLAGIGVLRARRWSGWQRPVPLLTGLYPFVAMFPLLALTGEPPLAMIALWGLLWMAVGYAIVTTSDGARARIEMERVQSPAGAR